MSVFSHYAKVRVKLKKKKKKLPFIHHETEVGGKKSAITTVTQNTKQDTTHFGDRPV